jgi:flagellar hook assembly protein FlgD
MIPTGIDEPASRVPRAAALSQNYPNPFNPSTTIPFEVPGREGDAQHVGLTIYTIRGERVVRLVDEEYEPGSHRVVWNGRDERGRQVPSGVYLTTLKCGGYSSTRKMVVMK